MKALFYIYNTDKIIETTQMSIKLNIGDKIEINGEYVVKKVVYDLKTKIIKYYIDYCKHISNYIENNYDFIKEPAK